MLPSRLALVQAPMAGVQDQRLTLAVARTGAVGSLPCAMLTPDAMRSQLQALHTGCAAQHTYNVNFFCHTPQTATAEQLARWQERLRPLAQRWHTTPGTGNATRQPFDAATAELLEEFKPPIVSFHFGLPAPDLLRKVKAWGSFVLSSATTVEEALWLVQHGADGVIAQGLEAGGHRGHFLSDDLTLQMGTFALLPQVVAALPSSVPVVAAGGINSPQAVQAAYALGASAVQCGTAYLCADEALTSSVHRAALQSPAARHTQLTTAFSGRPARGIVNAALRELGAFPEAAPPFPHASAAWAPVRAAAEAQGSGDASPLWSGQNASTCRSAPAAEITDYLLSTANTSNTP